MIATAIIGEIAELVAEISDAGAYNDGVVGGDRWLLKHRLLGHF